MSPLLVAVALIQGAGAPRVYALNDVPATPDFPYVVVAPSPKAPVVRTLDGSGNPAGRLVVQHFSRTFAGLDLVTEASFRALDAAALTELPDSPVCEQETASLVYRDPDDAGVLCVTHTYLF